MKRMMWLVTRLVVFAMMFTLEYAPANAKPVDKQDGNWNLAYKQAVKASGFDKGFLPEYTVDGLFSPFGPPECWRRSGEGPNWIEVTFPRKAQVFEIQVLLDRRALGLRFEAWARLSNGKLDSLGMFGGKPDGNGLLQLEIPKPRGGVTGVRLDMLDPGFPCIFELGIIGRIPGATIPTVVMPSCLSAPQVILHNANVITMNPAMPSVQAVAIKDGRIWAVGTDSFILRLSVIVPGSPPVNCTAIHNLGGRTLMPGFVEGHSHAIAFAPNAGRTHDEAISTLLRFGVTTTNELFANQDFLDDLFAMEAERRLRVRVNAYPLYNDAILDEDGDTILLHTWYRDHPPILDPYRMLRIPTVKIFVDGTSDSLHGCMALRDPYPEPFRSTPEFQDACFDDMVGDLFLSQSELTAAVQDIQARGYRVAFHAMGDAAVEQALNAIEIATGGSNFPRHQIHHNALIGPDQVDRYRSLGVLASVRGYWNTCNQDDYAYWFGNERQSWTVNRFALIHEGVKTFGEGDFGWGANPDDMTSPNPINPFLTIYGLVTHRQLRADGTACEPAPWVSIHNIDVQTALELVTINAAYANSQEDVIGSIEVDKLADVIVVTGDPLTLPSDDSLKDIRVLMTMVGGRTEYCAADVGGVCP